MEGALFFGTLRAAGRQMAVPFTVPGISPQEARPANSKQAKRPHAEPRGPPKQLQLPKQRQRLGRKRAALI